MSDPDQDQDQDQLAGRGLSASYLHPFHITRTWAYAGGEAVAEAEARLT